MIYERRININAIKLQVEAAEAMQSAGKEKEAEQILKNLAKDLLKLK